jgi:hypothetical protein
MSQRLRWTLWLGMCVLGGCGGGSSGSSFTSPSASSSSSGSGSTSSSSGATASNSVAVTVGPGPAAAGAGTFNIPYVSVTVCSPGTTTCATIDNVLVDTGSSGLRLMASALAAANLALTNTADPSVSGNTVAECLPFADGYTWGAVATADVSIAGELASGVSVHIIDDNSSYAATAPSSCINTVSQGGTASLNSVGAFAANGILGVGTSDQDCGPTCAECANVNASGCNANTDIYYSCNTSTNTCAFTPVAETAQVRNPVALFATDNNGVILTLESIPTAGQTTASGTLIFGIGTQSNNALGSAFVLTANDAGEFTTTYKGQVLSSSFIDSGSNGLYFPDSAITVCPSTQANPQANEFYCPSTTLSETAIMQGQDGSTNTVPFDVVNLNSINGSFYASDALAGPAPTNTGMGPYFDWGLPFFYGKRVFTAIDGKAVGTATGPFYAY